MHPELVVTAEAWSYAEKNLLEEGLILDSPNGYFVRVAGKIYALGSSAGSGSYSSVRFAYDQAGNYFVLKVSALRTNTFLEVEKQVEQYLGLFRGSSLSADQQNEYRIMPYLGKSLHVYLAEQANRLTAAAANSLVLKLIQAVLDLHNGWHPAGQPESVHVQIEPILHRDIKPQNLVISDTGEMHILDFGFSESLYGRKSFTSELCGSKDYLAPEVKQFKLFSFKSDIFAVGRVIEKIIDAVKKEELSRVNSLKTLQLLMCSIDPELRPHLEDVKVALVTSCYLDAPAAELSQQLKSAQCTVHDPEEAFLLTVFLLNSTRLSQFSQNSNLAQLMRNENLRVLLLEFYYWHPRKDEIILYFLRAETMDSLMGFSLQDLASSFFDNFIRFENPRALAILLFFGSSLSEFSKRNLAKFVDAVARELIDLLSTNHDETKKRLCLEKLGVISGEANPDLARLFAPAISPGLYSSPRKLLRDLFSADAGSEAHFSAR